MARTPGPGMNGRVSRPCGPVPRLAAGGIFALLVLAAACANPRGGHANVADVRNACTLAPTDAAWLAQALAGWQSLARRHIDRPSGLRTTAILFDAACVVTIDLATGVRSAALHSGRIAVPNGAVIPVGITAFAAPAREAAHAFFVMALPSVWRARGFSSELPLEQFTFAVFVHELSHVWQFDSYLRELRNTPGVAAMGLSLDDDLVQTLFSADADFAREMRQQIEGFRRAARASSVAEVIAAARPVRAAMIAHRNLAFAQRPAALHRVEDLFLTLEGSGQWLAVQALAAGAVGDAVPEHVALSGFATRGERWSQDLGLGIARVLDRIDPDWSRVAYGDGALTLLEMLDRALTAPYSPHPPPAPPPS